MQGPAQEPLAPVSSPRAHPSLLPEFRPLSFSLHTCPSFAVPRVAWLVASPVHAVPSSPRRGSLSKNPQGTRGIDRDILLPNFLPVQDSEVIQPREREGIVQTPQQGKRWGRDVYSQSPRAALPRGDRRCRAPRARGRTLWPRGGGGASKAELPRPAREVGWGPGSEGLWRGSRRASRSTILAGALPRACNQRLNSEPLGERAAASAARQGGAPRRRPEPPLSGSGPGRGPVRGHLLSLAACPESMPTPRIQVSTAPCSPVPSLPDECLFTYRGPIQKSSPLKSPFQTSQAAESAFATEAPHPVAPCTKASPGLLEGRWAKGGAVCKAKVLVHPGCNPAAASF